MTEIRPYGISGGQPSTTTNAVSPPICPHCQAIELASREFAALDAMIREAHPRPGDTRACPGCGRPQHYTGAEAGWCHDALVDTWHCADPRKDSHPPESVAAEQTRRIQPAAPDTRCGYCRRLIHQQRNGEWYHDFNASVFCRPGEGSDRRAFLAGA